MAPAGKAVRIAPLSMTTRHPVSFVSLTALLVLAPAVARAADDDIRLSTIGYLPDRSKVASVIGDAGSTFVLKRVSDDTPALTGNLSAAITDSDTSQQIRYADFLQLPNLERITSKSPTLDVRWRFQLLKTYFNSS